jgi:hypothetical protein
MGDKRGVYGTPEMIQLSDTPQLKYPTEVAAAAHMVNPDAPRFIEAPIGPLRVWCCRCRSLRPAEAFHRHNRRSGGYQAFCKACQKAHRKAKREAQRDTGGRWYRDEKRT